MSLYSFFASKGPSGFGYGSTAEEVTAGLSLVGKNILVTGCNTGLGKETLRVMALRGACALGTARTLEKAREACQSIKGHTLSFACELTDPASVRACVADIMATGLKLDAIICNAGIMALPQLKNVQGYEMQFFTNHIGHFILVTGLIKALSPLGRVVMVSSMAHRYALKGGIEFDNLDGLKGYSAWRQYGQSKFANILFAKELARRFKGTQQTANALHPGVVATDLPRNNRMSQWLYAAMGPFFIKDVAQGAATQVYVATHPALEKVSGHYFSNSNIAVPRADVDDRVVAQKLWEVSEKIVENLS